MSEELDRRLANVVRVGTIKELDEANARAKVDLGDLTTDWLPWATGRSGGNRSWDAHEVGEQVLLFAPSGELAAAVVMGSIPQDAYPAPASSKDRTRYQWADGAFQDYDRAGHHYVLDIPTDGDITLHVGASTLVLKNGEITAHIGSTTLKLEAGKTTLTTSAFDVVSPQSTFSGAVTVNGLLSYTAGMAGSGAVGGYSAAISGPVNITGPTTLANVTSNGKNISSTHTHNGVQSGPATSGGVS